METSKKNVCCIFNYPSHYRTSIYRLMESELDCDFYFGNIEEGKIKRMDYSSFKKPIRDLETIFILSRFNWIKGSISLVFKSYDRFIMVGEASCLSTWIILILCRLLNKKTYLWTHGWYGREHKPRAIVKKVFFGLSNELLLYGEYAKDLMLKEGFDKNKLHVIYNSLDYDQQLEIREQLHQENIFVKHFGNDYPVVVFTGRLTAVKKIDQLVKAHQILRRKGLNFNVLLLGDGTLTDDLKAQAEQAGLMDNYWFYGPCYDELIIGEFYYNAAVCVSPGNVGLTAIHSMMYGCPVISHSDFTNQMPEFEVIRPGETGDFFEYDNINSLAATLESWFKVYYPKTEMLRENCFHVVDERFNPHYQIEVLRNVI